MGALLSRTVPAHLGGIGLEQWRAVLCFYPFNQVGGHPVAAIGEHGVAAGNGEGSGRLGAQSQGQVAGQGVGIEAEAFHAGDGALDPDLTENADRHQVAGQVQRLAQSGGAIELAAVVLRAPDLLQLGIAEYHGGIVDKGRGTHAAFQCLGIDEGLEVGSRLALRLGCPVEVALFEVEAAHQGANRAVVGVYGHQCCLGLGNLGQAPVIVLAAHPDQVSRFQQARQILDRRRAGVFVDKEANVRVAGKFQVSLGAKAQPQGRRATVHCGDDGGQQRPRGRRVSKHLVPPGGVPVVAFGAAITVAGVIALKSASDHSVGAGL